MISPSDGRERAQLTTLDCLLRALAICPEEVFLVKVDVEDAELAVPKGTDDLLKRGSAKFIVEASNLKERGFSYSLRYSMKREMDCENYLVEK